MKQRAEIKTLARESFKEQRGIGILLYFLYTSVISFVVGIAAMVGIIPFIGSLISLINIGGNIDSLEDMSAFITSIVSSLSFFYILIFAVALILTPPLQVGLYSAFLRVFRKEKTHAEDIFTKLNTRFGRYLGGMLWTYLFTYLWSLLFCIPGIIKSYAYRMTPFILADHQEVKATDAIKLSMKMTKGHKGKLFVMDLSFIGWFLLSGLTCGILSIVYVMPYYTSTLAGYYEELKEQALASGAITAEELA